MNLLTQAMRGVESIDAPIGDEEDATKLDFVRGNERDDPGVAFQDRSMIDCIQKSLNELNPREAQVLRLRYASVRIRITRSKKWAVRSVSRANECARLSLLPSANSARRTLRNVCVTISRAEITSSKRMLFLMKRR